LWRGREGTLKWYAVAMSNPPKYVDKVAFDVLPEVWAAAKAEVRSILVEVAQRERTIFYSELVGEMKTINLEAHDQRLFALLGHVSQDEHELGHPLLSVIVVHKEGTKRGMPGDGFFVLAKSLGFDTRNKEKLWADETARVHGRWSKPATGRR
jgi:hypothetical protein